MNIYIVTEYENMRPNGFCVIVAESKNAAIKIAMDGVYSSKRIEDVNAQEVDINKKGMITRVDANTYTKMPNMGW